MEVAKGSLPSNAVTGGGVTLDGFASRGREASGTAPGQDDGGAELPQQYLGHRLSGRAPLRGTTSDAQDKLHPRDS